MRLTITDEALHQLQLLQPEGRPYLRMEYDIEGCGCGVNGVPTVYFTDKSTEYDINVENEHYTIFLDEQQTVFFKPEMKLEWNKRLFRLKSPNGMLNPSLSSASIKQGGEPRE